ncbi:MAG: folate family ECF transporter S component [Butyrivibrio sp.]|nr:folate family ECF transporter S component [Butyrivibrio sp.]
MNLLKVTKALTLAAMLTAVGIILSFFKIPLTPIIEIRFGSLPIAVAGMSLGPIVAAIIGAVIDVLGFFVKPTGPFFPGFTISGIVSGLIFGLVLYKKKLHPVRILVALVLQTLVVGIIMNTFWLDFMYIKAGFFTTLMMRLPKELVMLPINYVLLSVFLYSLQRVTKYAEV